MEDHREEFWEIEEEYLPSYEDYPPSYDYKSDSKLGWIWKKGLSFGKKAVVTGAVISSAPLVIPPILALSALGVAFSVPAGFAFVTYACTDKIVNFLVPVQPPKSEKVTVYSDDEEYETVSEDELQKGYEEDVDMEAEEKEFEEDTKKGVEMRIQFTDEDAYGQDYFTFENEFRTRTTVGDTVEEGGYEEDDGEYMELEEQPLNSSAAHEVLKGIREAEDEISLGRESGDIPTDSLQAVVVEAEVSGENENDVEQVLENLAYAATTNDEEEKDSMESFTGIDEAEDEISLGGGSGNIPGDSLQAVVAEAEVSGEHENDVKEELENLVYVAARNLGEEESGHTETFTGIDEAEDEIFLGGGSGDIPRDSLQAVVVEAEVSGGNENDVELVSEYLAYVAASNIDVEENDHTETFTGIDKEEMRQETTALIEKFRDEDEQKWQGGAATEIDKKDKKDEEKGGVSVTGMDQDKGNKHLFIIPEQVWPERDVQVHADVWQDTEATQILEKAEGEGALPVTNMDQDKVNENLFVIPEQARPEGDAQIHTDVWQDREAAEIAKKDEGEGGLPIADMNQDKGDKNLLVIPEQVRPGRDALIHTDVWQDKEAADIAKNDKKEGAVPITDNQDLENKNLFVIPEEARPDRDVQIYEAHDGINLTTQEVCKREMKDPKLIVEKKLVVHVKTRDGHTATDVRQETGSDVKTGTLFLSSADARVRADQSGFGFTDDTHEAYDNVSDLVDRNAEEKHIFLKKLIVNVDYHEVPAWRPTVTSSGQVSTASGSDKLQVSVAEEKIWEQLNAIRTIVGYTVAANASCAEELKALYVFTGVEPPAPSGDSDSLMNVSEKLHFLMSIIGVK